MKHVIIFPVYAFLFILSLLIGVILWSYSFRKSDFRKGTSFINTKLIKFADWYSITRE